MRDQTFPCLVTHLRRESDNDISAGGPLTHGVQVVQLDIRQARYFLEVFLVDQAVCSGHQPVGGDDGGRALHTGGRLEVKDCHEGWSILSLSYYSSYDSVLTFLLILLRVYFLIEKKENDERDKYFSHADILIYNKYSIVMPPR